MRRESRQPSRPAQRAPIFHYYKSTVAPEAANRPPKRSSKLSAQLRHPKLSLRNLPSVIAVLLILGVLVGNLYLSSVPAYRFGNKPVGLRSQSSYEKGIKELLASSIWNKSKITFNSRSAEAAVLKKYPEISEVTISIPLIGRQPVVGIIFNEPAVVVKTITGNYIVGGDGRVLIEGITEPGLPQIEDVSGVEYQTGKRVLTVEDLEKLKVIFSELQAHNLSATNLKIGLSPRDISLQLSDSKYLVKLNFSYDMREQLGAVWATREQLASQGKVPSEYIDARLAERVFVK